jgi:hypothetical protein
VQTWLPLRLWPSLDQHHLEDEELAAVEKPLDQAEREAIGREMVRSAAALERVEQEAVRWVLAISAIFLLAKIWPLDFYPFLPPAVFANLAEAGITLLVQAVRDESMAYVIKPPGRFGLEQMSCFGSLTCATSPSELQMPI